MEERSKKTIRDSFYFFSAIFLSLGIFVGIELPVFWIPLIITLLVSVSLFFQKSDTLFISIISILIFSSGWIISSIRLNEINQNLEIIDSLHEETITFSGIIQSTKETEHG